MTEHQIHQGQALMQEIWKADQKKFIGNAVEVTIARAWCVALCRQLDKTSKTKIRQMIL